MPPRKTRATPNSSGKKTSAGLAGAGGGTLLVLIANTLPDPWNKILASLAPTFSIALAWVLVFLYQYVESKRIDLWVARATRTLEKALANPHTGEEHKEFLRHKLEELEVIQTNTDFELIKSQ